jgi:hypothetical protein
LWRAREREKGKRYSDQTNIHPWDLKKCQNIEIEKSIEIDDWSHRNVKKTFIGI